MSRQTDDTLKSLIESTEEFFARFDATPQLSTTLRVFQEEVGELIESAKEGVDMNHIAEECADVFVTAIGICLAHGIDAEQILAQTQMVIEKNDAKTHETHAINEYGKIARRA